MNDLLESSLRYLQQAYPFDEVHSFVTYNDRGFKGGYAHIATYRVQDLYIDVMNESKYTPSVNFHYRRVSRQGYRIILLTFRDGKLARKNIYKTGKFSDISFLYD